MTAARALLLAALVAALPAPAHAGGYDFRGGCSHDNAEVADPHGHVTELGSWSGVLDVLVIATGPAPDRVPAREVPVTDVWCELVVNGVSEGEVLRAPDGTGATAAARAYTRPAGPTDVVTICTHATIGGTPFLRCPNGELWEPTGGVWTAVDIACATLREQTGAGCGVLEEPA